MIIDTTSFIKKIVPFSWGGSTSYKKLYLPHEAVLNTRYDGGRYISIYLLKITFYVPIFIIFYENALLSAKSDLGKLICHGYNMSL